MCEEAERTWVVLNLRWWRLMSCKTVLVVHLFPASGLKVFVCFLLASNPIIQILVLAPYHGKLWLSSADVMFSGDWKLCPSTPPTPVKHCGVLRHHGAFFLWMGIPFPWVLSEALSSSQQWFTDTNVCIEYIKEAIDKGEWRRERKA